MKHRKDVAREARESGTIEADPGVPWRGTLGNDAGSFRWWLGVFVLALAVRLLAVWQTSDVATVRYLVGDAAGYMAWARQLAAGAWMGTESFYQAPLYPYVLGALCKLGGSSITWVRVVQCVWGATGCVLVGYAARRMFGSRVGWLSALMLVCYAPAIYYDGIIQKASMSCLLSCGVLAGVVISYKRMRGARPFVLGMVVGLLCLTRENALVWLGVLGVWVIWHAGGQGPTPTSFSCSGPPLFSPSARGRKREVERYTKTSFAIAARLRAGALYGAGAWIALAPALTHNVYVSGVWSVTTSQSGPNFYIGNSAEADGRYRPLVRGHETPSFEREDATRLAEADSGRTLSAGEVSAYWVDRGWRVITADPLRWMGLMARKLLMTVNRYEVADGDSFFVHAQSSWVLSWSGTVWHFGLLFPLGVYGLVLARQQRWTVGVFAALCLSMMVAVALFFVLGRYRLPLVPMLIPFAAYGLAHVVDSVTQRQWRTTCGGVAVVVPVALLCSLPVQDEGRLNALAAMNAGVALAQRGEVDEALGLFEEAVEACPASAEANVNAALALAVSGRFAEAIPYYRRALVVAPTLPGAEFNLGVALERAGDPVEALKHYQAAARQDPQDREARRAVTRLRGQR